MGLLASLAQQLMRYAGVPRVVMVTCGVLAPSPSHSATEVAQGGAWGFARVLRLHLRPLPLETPFLLQLLLPLLLFFDLEDALLLQHLHLSGVALRLHAGLVVQGSVLLGAVLSNRTQNKV